MSARTAAATLAKSAGDEVAWVLLGAATLTVGVAMVYLPAAVILAGLLLTLLGVGRMRA